MSVAFFVEGAQSTPWDTPGAKFRPFDLENIVNCFKASGLMVPGFTVALYVPLSELHDFTEKAKAMSPGSRPQVILHCLDDLPTTSPPGASATYLDEDSVLPELIFHVGDVEVTYFDMDGEDRLRGRGMMWASHTFISDVGLHRLIHESNFVPVNLRCVRSVTYPAGMEFDARFVCVIRLFHLTVLMSLSVVSRFLCPNSYSFVWCALQCPTVPGRRPLMHYPHAATRPSRGGFARPVARVPSA